MIRRTVASGLTISSTRILQPLMIPIPPGQTECVAMVLELHDSIPDLRSGGPNACVVDGVVIRTVHTPDVVLGCATDTALRSRRWLSPRMSRSPESKRLGHAVRLSPLVSPQTPPCVSTWTPTHASSTPVEEALVGPKPKCCAGVAHSLVAMVAAVWEVRSQGTAQAPI